jgi:hypothetical protein
MPCADGVRKVCGTQMDSPGAGERETRDRGSGPVPAGCCVEGGAVPGATPAPLPRGVGQ